jgi:hypothetical protein
MENTKQQFTDGQNRIWHFITDYAAGRRVIEATGLDLFELTDPQSDGFKQFTRDRYKLFDAITAVLRPEMERRGVSVDDMAQAINREDVAAAAAVALFAAVANFTQPQKGAVIMQTLEKTIDITKQMEAEALEKMQETLDSGDLEAAIRESITGTPGKPG